MQTVASALLIGLASSYLAVAWFHGSIFNSWRNYLETDGLVFAAREKGRSHRYIGWMQLVTDLLSCPFCLSAHLCFWLHLLGYLTGVPGTMAGIICGPAASAAICVYTYPHVKRALFGNDSDDSQ